MLYALNILKTVLKAFIDCTEYSLFFLNQPPSLLLIFFFLICIYFYIKLCPDFKQSAGLFVKTCNISFLHFELLGGGSHLESQSYSVRRIITLPFKKTFLISFELSNTTIPTPPQPTPFSTEGKMEIMGKKWGKKTPENICQFFFLQQDVN